MIKNLTHNCSTDSISSFCLLLLLLFYDRVWLCSSSWNLTHIPVFGYWVLGLQVCATPLALQIVIVIYV